MGHYASEMGPRKSGSDRSYESGVPEEVVRKHRETREAAEFFLENVDEILEDIDTSSD